MTDDVLGSKLSAPEGIDARPSEARSPSWRIKQSAGLKFRRWWKRNTAKYKLHRRARYEVRQFLPLLRRVNVEHDDLRRGIPALARCFTARVFLFNTLLGFMLLAIFVLITISGLIALSESVDFSRDLLVFVALCPLAFVPMTIVMRRVDDDYKRFLASATRAQQISVRYSWFTVPIISFCLVMFLYWVFNIFELSPLRLQEWILVTAQLLLLAAYNCMVYWGLRIILRRLAPELELVRNLANAFELIATVKPAKWRSIAVRRKIGRHIGAAATVLEVAISRKLGSAAGSTNRGQIATKMHGIGSALRNKIVWLATPMEDTREFLARALAKELLIAAAGNYDRLEFAEVTDVQVKGSWLKRVLDVTRRGIFGVGPIAAIAAIKYYGVSLPPGVFEVLVQFAGLLFVTAILSELDPGGYKEKLSTAAGTGAALFGWKKSKE